MVLHRQSGAGVPKQMLGRKSNGRMAGEQLTKAGIHGILTSGASVGIIGVGNNVNIPFLNVTVPLYIVMFGVGVASSALSDVVHQIVKDDIPLSRKGADQASLVLGAVASGYALQMALALLNPKLPGEFGFATSFAIGAGSELGASFIQNMIM